MGRRLRLRRWGRAGRRQTAAVSRTRSWPIARARRRTAPTRTRRSARRACSRRSTAATPPSSTPPCASTRFTPRCRPRRTLSSRCCRRRSGATARRAARRRWPRSSSTARCVPRAGRASRDGATASLHFPSPSPLPPTQLSLTLPPLPVVPSLTLTVAQRDPSEPPALRHRVDGPPRPEARGRRAPRRAPAAADRPQAAQAAVVARLVDMEGAQGELHLRRLLRDERGDAPPL